MEKAQKLEPKNFWVSKQLSLLFAQSNQWDQANKALENIKNANEALESRAIFLLQSGGNPADAWNISKNSVPIAIKAIKYFLLENKEKKAYDIIAKSWNRLQHIDMIKAFIYQEKPSVKTSLRRFKLLQKALKPSLRYDETNLGMALASLDASMWGETKKYLERIKKENWDERVAKIWIELRTKSDKIEIPEIPKKLKSEPKWYCENCKTELSTDVHHLQYQQDANEEGFIGDFHKNTKANLMSLCEKCHLEIHKKNKKMKRKKTTKGTVLEEI